VVGGGVSRGKKSWLKAAERDVDIDLLGLTEADHEKKKKDQFIWLYGFVQRDKVKRKED